MVGETLEETLENIRKKLDDDSDELHFLSGGLVDSVSLIR